MGSPSLKKAHFLLSSARTPFSQSSRVHPVKDTTLLFHFRTYSFLGEDNGVAQQILETLRSSLLTHFLFMNFFQRIFFPLLRKKISPWENLEAASFLISASEFSPITSLLWTLAFFQCLSLSFQMFQKLHPSETFWKVILVFLCPP